MRYAPRMPEEQIDSSVSTSGLSARLSGTGLIASILPPVLGAFRI